MFRIQKIKLKVPEVYYRFRYLYIIDSKNALGKTLR